MADAWTIGRLLTWTTDYLKQHGADSPRLDAEVLLAEASGRKRIELYTAFHDEPSEPVRQAFRELVKRRAAGTPVAYLVGRREFFSLSFQVSSDVLIPRPETELLVIRLLDLIKERGDSRVAVADVGTGSGVIAICAAKFAPVASVTAIDLSATALAVAARNAAQHGVADRVRFLAGDLLDAAPAGEKFDFIVSNPPYISTAEMAALPKDVREYEPHIALAAGERGTDVIERLIPQAAARLNPGGWLLLEISPQIDAAVRELIPVDRGWRLQPTQKDLAGHSRVVAAERVSGD